MSPSDRLAAHLDSWLGDWPPSSDRPVTVTSSPARSAPGWDGRIRPVAGISTPEGTVLSVPEEHVPSVAALGATLDEIAPHLAEVVARPGWRFHSGIFRWTGSPTPFDRPGVWIPRDDPRVPEWLHPFNGSVLVALEDDIVVAGVGRKIHDRHGHELAVVTEEGHRGKGWAKRLISQAAERVLADGAIPTYLHGPGNEASARTAEACGFPDRGWRILGLLPESPG